MGASEKLEQAKKINEWGLGMNGRGLGKGGRSPSAPSPPPLPPFFFSSLAPIFRSPPLSESLEQAK